MKKQRFLIIGQLPPPVHGSNVMTARFIKALKELGYEANIVQKTFSKDINDLHKFTIYKFFQIPIIVSNFLKQLLFNKPDICFYRITVGLSSFLFDSFLIFILRIFKIPYVLYCGGRGFNELAVSHNNLLKKVIYNTIGKATGAIVLGEQPKEDLLPFLDEDNLFVLPNAVDNHIDINTLPSRKNRNLIKVIFLSNLIESKGPLQFLAMAKEVNSKISQVRFVLAGNKTSDSLYNKILNYIKNEGLEKIVELPGGLYGERKNYYFQDSDIFVFPTQKDVFPSVILEAMQWGLPVISSGEGAIPEVVIDGVTGYIVNPKDIGQLTDRVLRLVRDPALRRRMGEAGRRRYEDYYSIEAYKRNLQKALQFFGDIIPFKNWSSSP